MSWPLSRLSLEQGQEGARRWRGGGTALFHSPSPVHGEGAEERSGTSLPSKPHLSASPASHGPHLSPRSQGLSDPRLLGPSSLGRILGVCERESRMGQKPLTPSEVSMQVTPACLPWEHRLNSSLFGSLCPSCFLPSPCCDALTLRASSHPLSFNPGHMDGPSELTEVQSSLYVHNRAPRAPAPQPH